MDTIVLLAELKLHRERWDRALPFLEAHLSCLLNESNFVDQHYAEELRALLESFHGQEKAEGSAEAEAPEEA